jgi:hypothetical protein
MPDKQEVHHAGSDKAQEMREMTKKDVNNININKCELTSLCVNKHDRYSI